MSCIYEEGDDDDSDAEVFLYAPEFVCQNSSLWPELCLCVLKQGTGLQDVGVCGLNKTYMCIQVCVTVQSGTCMGWHAVDSDQFEACIIIVVCCRYCR